MVFIIDGKGNMLNAVPERVYQGSNLANGIILAGPVPLFTKMTIAATLPNGINLSESLMTSGGRFDGQVPGDAPWYYWTTDIEAAMTEFTGKVVLQFRGYNGVQIVATGSGGFFVEPGVPTELPPEPTPDIYQQILAEVAKINQTADNLTQPPDVSEANQFGVADVSFTDDGRFKFSYLKGNGIKEVRFVSKSGTVSYYEMEFDNGYIFQFSLADGKPGVTTPNAMTPIWITEDMWTGMGPYTLTVSPDIHGLGETPYLFVSLKPDSSSVNPVYRESYDSPQVADNGVITVDSYVKWTGLMLVGGGFSVVEGIEDLKERVNVIEQKYISSEDSGLEPVDIFL